MSQDNRDSQTEGRRVKGVAEKVNSDGEKIPKIFHFIQGMSQTNGIKNKINQKSNNFYFYWSHWGSLRLISDLDGVLPKPFLR